MIARLCVAAKVALTYQSLATYLLNRLGLQKDPYVILTLRNGTRYKIRNRRVTTTDSYVINETWIHGVHDAAAKYISDNAIVIDVGAHIGAFSIFAATRARGVKVFCFEPDEDNIVLLTENARLNNVKAHLTIVPKAVSGHRGVRKLYLSSVDTGMHTLLFERRAFHEAEFRNATETTVECTTLNDVFDEFGLLCCDVLKMDCEGAEFEILYNTSPEILRRIRCISVEYHVVPAHSIEALKEFLLSNRFLLSLPCPGFSVLLAESRDAH